MAKAVSGIGGLQGERTGVNVGQSWFAKEVNGMALRGVAHTSYCWVPVCDSALYMNVENNVNNVLDPNVSKELVIKYLRYIPKSAFVWQTTDSIAKNGFLKPQSKECMQANLDQFNSFYTDVNQQDCFALSYNASSGTSELKLNGSTVGSIKSRAFGTAVFSIWFGAYPFMESMKENLLTRLAESL